MSGKVALLCRWGGSFGMGHVQRMGSLWSYLREKNVEAFFVSDRPLPIDCSAQSVRSFDEIESGMSCIIRDMRDSIAEEIEQLKQIAPVIAVDDLGQGRDHADRAIDLLPNLAHQDTAAVRQPFIYGYNFVRAIELLKQREIFKTIDFCFYAGADAADSYKDFLKNLLPENSNAIILGGNTATAVNIKDGKLSAEYPFPLLLSANMISHFGVSLFEAGLCGCNLFSINPTKYHSDLCDISKPYLKLENFGVYPEIDTAYVKNRLKEAASAGKKSVNAGQIRDNVRHKLDLFFETIKPLL